MDNETTTQPSPVMNFAKEIAIDVVKATAVSVGVFGGMVVVGLAVRAYEDRKARRTTETPETENN